MLCVDAARPNAEFKSGSTRLSFFALCTHVKQSSVPAQREYMS